MAVEIISGTNIAAMYCTTSDTAFGPVFFGAGATSEAYDFLAWLNDNPDGGDARGYTAEQLAQLVKDFWDAQTYVGGPDA
jgi:hypothetical protein